MARSSHRHLEAMYLRILPHVIMRRCVQQEEKYLRNLGNDEVSLAGGNTQMWAGCEAQTNLLEDFTPPTGVPL